MSNPISNLGTIPSFSCAGVLFTDLSSNLKVMAGTANSTTSNPRYQVLNTPQGVNYQVTSGKTLTIRACKIYNNDVSTPSRAVLIYGTTAVSDSASAPSGEVDWFGLSTGRNWLIVGGNSSTFVNGVNSGEVAPFFQVPSTDFPHIKAVSGTTEIMLAYGYEA